jgi:hypothetical protein
MVGYFQSEIRLSVYRYNLRYFWQYAENKVEILNQDLF